MRIGIIDSGLMGGKLGTIFARAGTPREAALHADALLLAVHCSHVDAVLKQAGDLFGKVIVTCSLPMNASDTALAVAHTSSGAETLAKKVRKAHRRSAVLGVTNAWRRSEPWRVPDAQEVERQTLTTSIMAAS